MDAGYKKKLSPNPRVTANLFSLATFGWVLDIFKRGYKKDLEVDDLYEALDEHRSELLGDQLTRFWDEEVKRSSAKHGKPSLIWVLFRCHGLYSILLELLLAFMELCIVMPQPIFLGKLIRYFAPETKITYETAFISAGFIIITTAVNVFIGHAHAMACFHVGMKIRVGLCSLIYRKALKLSKSALGETTVGQAVNLMSNDVTRFDIMLLFLAYIWIGPLETLIIGYLVWNQIGVSAIIGISAVLVVIPLQGILGKVISSLRLRTAKRTDQRIKFMNEIIVGMQVIKMYAWEKPFAHLVSLARKREIRAVRASAYTQGFLMCFARLMGKNVAIFLSIVAYVLLEKKAISAEQMFVVTAYFNTLSISMALFLSLAIRFFAEGLTSIERIRTFLVLDEMEITSSLDQNCANSHVNSGQSSKNVTSDMKTTRHTNLAAGDAQLEKEKALESVDGIRITNLSAKWDKDFSENTLNNVNLHVRSGTLVAIIGPVGSGKTSLINAILKELPLTCGSISVGGSISYASQEPWLFTGAIRQNILFGQPMNKERYRQVIRACALERDLQLLPNGDKTIVGERGVTLSGGQKARINLARAVYKEADIYLLDDPLSAVDTHVGRHLFEDCITDFLQNKTRILITHQLQYLQTANKIVILNNGGIDATGTYTDLQESGLDFAKQLAMEPEEHEETTSKSALARLYSRERQNSETSAMSSEFEPETVAEMRSHGGVGFRVYQSYCAAAGNCCIVMVAFGVFVLSQIAVSAENYWMAYWSRVEEMNAGMLNNSIETNSTVLEYPTTANTCFYCIYVFTALLIAVVVFDVGSAMLFYTLCMRASVRLHNSMFASITRATMWFFNNHPSGQILNRFSKDMGSIDEFLPHILIDCVQIGLALIGVVTVVAIVNFWLIIPTAVMFVIFYIFRTYYVSTSRNIKRLEGITRSPVFSHLSATLQGLTTIRAFHAEALLSKEFDSHQDLHSSAWFMFISSSRAFALWLDSSCTIYIALVTVSFLFVNKDGEHGGDVGLAITQAIGLIGMIQWGIRQSAELENSMTSLERVLEYTTIESEPPLESLPDKKPNENWPTEGAIIFNKASLTYSKDEPPVLKKISFTVNPSEKVGIVGRTGAGKSSLISALFRLVELSDGSILIDGVNTASIGIHDLRSKISIIPQEPALFSGTLRENLDPFNEYSDGVLWAALGEVELKQVVEELPAGLSHKVLEGGSNFSVGQRQLLCLARAIIRNNKILVLDEATANVDPQTDELIQATIRHKFVNCTVLTIAHRLHTVMDSERILVMEAGSVSEYDHPHILLQNKKGMLYQMVQQTGQAMTESLFKVAQTYYEKKREESREVES